MPSQTPDTRRYAALLLRLIGGDPAAVAEVLALAPSADEPSLLVAATLLSREDAYLVRARSLAASARERQLVVLADAHLCGNNDLFDVLVREHLADYPDHLLAAWIAGQPR